jgi:hypothetical protein
MNLINLYTQSNRRSGGLSPKYAFPLYYSQGAVFIFTLFCYPLFGSVLLAMNLRMQQEKKGAKEVLLFGMLCNFVQLPVGFYGTPGILVNYIFNIAAALVLVYIFWPRYISNTLYQSRSIRKPLIAGIGIYVVIYTLLIVTLRMAL